jgi:DNA repair photolyase
LRLKALAELRHAELQAGVFVMPVLPGITDGEADLEALAEAAATHRAQWLAANVLCLMPSAQKVFFPFLDEKFPRLAKQYRRWYARNAYAPEDYRRRISSLFARLRAKHDLASKPNPYDVDGLTAPEVHAPPSSEETQLDLGLPTDQGEQLPASLSCTK